MKAILKIAVFGGCLVFVFMLDVPPELPLRAQLVPEAHAVLGVRRRSFRRGVAVGATAATEESAYHAQQESAPPPAPSQPAAAPPSPPAASDTPLPLGTVVHTLPAGCTSTPVGGVNYFYCGGNFYRAVFQGNELVYVTAKP